MGKLNSAKRKRRKLAKDAYEESSTFEAFIAKLSSRGLRIAYVSKHKEHMCKRRPWKNMP